MQETEVKQKEWQASSISLVSTGDKICMVFTFKEQIWTSFSPNGSEWADATHLSWKGNHANLAIHQGQIHMVFKEDKFFRHATASLKDFDFYLSQPHDLEWQGGGINALASYADSLTIAFTRAEAQVYLGWWNQASGALDRHKILSWRAWELAVVSFHDTLYLFHVGTEGRLYVSRP